VDGEGYVLPDVFLEAVKHFYLEDSLKIVVEKFAPSCSRGANSFAKGRFKALQI
jgi:hypothetical protein